MLEHEAEAPRLTIDDGTGSEVVIPTTTTVQSDDSESVPYIGPSLPLATMVVGGGSRVVLRGFPRR